MNIKFIKSLLALLVALLCFCPTWAQVNSGVSVIASQEFRHDGAVLYHYKVENKSDRAIVGIAVGSDYYHGVSELNAYPSGWSFDNGIPDDSASAPADWKAEVITTEESSFVEIQWRNSGHSDILPNQSASGFGVVLQRQNMLYLTAHWTVLFADGTAASGPLLADGNPRIVATLGNATQVAPGQWMVAVQIANRGGGAAQQINVAQVVFRTLEGSGNVSLASSPLPAQINNLNPGTAATVQLTLNVPASVRKFSITENGTLRVTGGGTLAFSSAQVFYPKN